MASISDVPNRGEQLVLETLDVLMDTIDNAVPGDEGWISELADKYAGCARTRLGMLEWAAISWLIRVDGAGVITPHLPFGFKRVGR